MDVSGARLNLEFGLEVTHTWQPDPLGATGSSNQLSQVYICEHLVFSTFPDPPFSYSLEDRALLEGKEVRFGAGMKRFDSLGKGRELGERWIPGSAGKLKDEHSIPREFVRIPPSPGVMWYTQMYEFICKRCGCDWTPFGWYMVQVHVYLDGASWKCKTIKFASRDGRRGPINASQPNTVISDEVVCPR
jgi:hypothetical protein